MEENQYMMIQYEVDMDSDVIKTHKTKLDIKKIQLVYLSNKKEMYPSNYYSEIDVPEYYQKILERIDGSYIHIKNDRLDSSLAMNDRKITLIFMLDYKTILRNKKIEEILL